MPDYILENITSKKLNEFCYIKGNKFSEIFPWIDRKRKIRKLISFPIGYLGRYEKRNSHKNPKEANKARKIKSELLKILEE